MSSGALMFLFPVFRISWLQVIEAISVGAFVSILLIFTTKFEVKNDEIYLKPSRSFIFILFGLFFLRLILKMIIGSHIDRSEEHTSELQSRGHLVCRLLLENKNKI